MTIPALPAVVTLAALITYQGTAMAVGQARVQHKVMPPASSGPEEFERALRVQHIGTEVVVHLERAIRSEVPKVLQRFFNPVQITHLHETWWRSDGEIGRAHV